MTPQLTIDALREMRFSGMAAEFQFQLDDPAYYAQLGFEERFSMLVTAELSKRRQNKLDRMLHQAHFAAPGAREYSAVKVPPIRTTDTTDPRQ